MFVCVVYMCIHVFLCLCGMFVWDVYDMYVVFVYVWGECVPVCVCIPVPMCA